MTHTHTHTAKYCKIFKLELEVLGNSDKFISCNG